MLLDGNNPFMLLSLKINGIVEENKTQSLFCYFGIFK